MPFSRKRKRSRCCVDQELFWTLKASCNLTQFDSQHIHVKLHNYCMVWINLINFPFVSNSSCIAHIARCARRPVLSGGSPAHVITGVDTIQLQWMGQCVGSGCQRSPLSGRDVPLQGSKPAFEFKPLADYPVSKMPLEIRPWWGNELAPGAVFVPAWQVDRLAIWQLDAWMFTFMARRLDKHTYNGRNKHSITMAQLLMRSQIQIQVPSESYRKVMGLCAAYESEEIANFSIFVYFVCQKSVEKCSPCLQ